MKSDLILKNMHFKLMLTELKRLEENREYCRHDITHLTEVARIMLLINDREKLNLNHDNIVATALLHDLGRVKQYKDGTDHRISDINVIKNILIDCGYESEDISEIINAIKHHDKLTTEPLASLLYRADKLSRPCYTCKAKDCYWDESIKNKEYYK